MGSVWSPNRLHPLTTIQVKLRQDRQHRFFVVPAGRRSRKTIIGSRKVLDAALRVPNTRYFESAPTRQQAKAILWEQLKENTKGFWGKDPSESELAVFLANKSEIRVEGLDQARRLEGQPWDGGHITEFTDCKRGIFGANIRPALSDRRGWCYLDGVPEGRSNDMYDLALYACGGSLPVTIPGDGAFMECPTDPDWCYYHWFSEDVLPMEEIEAARRQLDEKTFNQEYRGSFEGYDGLAYYSFSQVNIRPAPPLDKSREVIVGMDFNFDPMCSVVAQERNMKTHIEVDCLAAFDFRNCNTDNACHRIIDRFGDDCTYTVYPDPACKSRSAHGVGASDLALIREAFNSRCKTPVNVLYRNAHPKRKDRLNSVNAMLKNATGIPRLFVDPNECKPLIKDFQKCGMEDFLNGHYSDSSLGHAGDGIGYYLEYRFPVAQGDGGYKLSGGRF